MGFDKETIATYDNSATELAEYFKGYGPRVLDIEQAFELADNPPAARVVEIGCGDGRDAAEITKRAAWYEGFDPSVGLLEIARARNLNGNFVQADALSYDYPENLDIVFAFASLLHVDKTDLGKVFKKLHQSLRIGGTVFLSLKERDHYEEEMQTDDFGDRQFYFYNAPGVIDIAGPDFKPTYEDHQLIGKTNWFTLALQKV